MMFLLLRPRLALLAAPAAAALMGSGLRALGSTPTGAALVFVAAILAGWTLASTILGLLRGRVPLRLLFLVAALCAPAWIAGQSGGPAPAQEAAAGR